MENPIKKVAAIHDLSGFGRVSLTAVIPILSSMGIQVCPFPTAILSNCTSYFDEFSFVDLTDSMVDYMNHWKKEDMKFDCIYSGFLGSEKQVDIVLDFIDAFKEEEDNIVVVDPVMADNGRLYPTMNEEMIKKMKQLIEKSDIITPNFTEASYLLGREYTSDIKEDKIRRMLVELSKLGPEKVVITSVKDDVISENIDVFGYERKKDKFWKVGCKQIPIEFPGTGDIFTSILVGNLLNGSSLDIALDKSVEFMSDAIRESYNYSYPNREGILLEKMLKNLK